MRLALGRGDASMDTLVKSGLGTGTPFPCLSLSPLNRTRRDAAACSPLSRAVGLDEAYQGRGRQGLSGKDTTLQLKAEAAERIPAEHHLRGLRVHNLPTGPHRTGGQGHCGTGNTAHGGLPGQEAGEGGCDST